MKKKKTKKKEKKLTPRWIFVWVRCGRRMPGVAEQKNERDIYALPAEGEGGVGRGRGHNKWSKIPTNQKTHLSRTRGFQTRAKLCNVVNRYTRCVRSAADPPRFYSRDGLGIVSTYGRQNCTRSIYKAETVRMRKKNLKQTISIICSRNSVRIPDRTNVAE